MRWINDDGGRAEAGFRGEAGDCVTRSIAIATEQPYKVVYDELAERSKTIGRARSARDGVVPKVYKAYLAELGWTWKPTMFIGSGTTVHLREDEIPGPGRLVVRCSRHLTAVVDNVIHDTHDPSRGGDRAVYGYWYKED